MDTDNNRNPVVIVRGTGSIGSRHLRVLRELVGVAPIAFPFRPSSAPALRNADFEVATTLDQVKLLRPDAAIVASRTSSHVKDAIALMEAGCDVLIENPLSVDSSELNQLAHCARRLEKKVFVGCYLRFDKGLLMFREQIASIGRLHSVRIECQSYLPDWRPGRDHRSGFAATENEGGVLRDLFHELDYATWIFGRPKTVFAKLENFGILGIDSDESADLFWHTETHVPVSVHLDYLTRNNHRGIRAYGDLGEIEWRAQDNSVIVRIAGADEKLINFQQARDDHYAQQSTQFLYAMTHGEAGNLATFEDGAFTMALCDAARRSSETGRMEEIFSSGSTVSTERVVVS